MLLESATLLIAVAIDSILNKNLFPLAEPKKKQKRESDTGVSLSLSLPMAPAASLTSELKEQISEAQVKKPARARKKPSEGKPQRSPAPRSSA